MRIHTDGLGSGLGIRSRKAPVTSRPPRDELFIIRDTLAKFVGEEVRDAVLKETTAPHDQLREVTLLFADLRDFTGWVEATPPEEVAQSLNAYFSEMEHAIRRHRGLVLQFIGDEIEASFGAPLRCDDHADMAVEAALEMRIRLDALNARRAREGRPRLRHGIGIHTGTVLAGTIGSTSRRFYALIGDAVNVASRIQGVNKEVGSDILVSGNTRRRVGGPHSFASVEPRPRLKGHVSDVELYRLL